jgi:beta-aspartyl-peptidase (threonine type)
MIVIASTNGAVGIHAAVEMLRQGGRAIDAVEMGIRIVEDNVEDHSVGSGSYLNLLGEVELDAGIMDGRSLGAGAVGAMRAYRNPISVARQVMERLPHVFLVGPGAERFAAEMGFEACDLATEEALKTWRERLLVDMAAEEVEHLAERPDLWRWVEIATDPQRTKGTVNFIAQDGAGDICAGVSTSGWAWKYPGRVGDSPIVGAGLYADNRYGAAACTGMGEMAIRAGTARALVLYLKMGLSLAEAGREAMRDLDDLGGRYLGGMNFIVLDACGRHAGFSNGEGGRYLAMTPAMEHPKEMERTCVPTKMRWASADRRSSE